MATGSSEPIRPQSTQSSPPLPAKTKGKHKAAHTTRSSDTLLNELKQIASEVINKDVSVDAPLMDAGLDSISATELSNKISAHLNADLSPTLLFDHPSLRSIAGALSANSDSSPTQEFEPAQEAHLLPTVVHDVPKRATPQISGKAVQSTASIIKSIQTTL